MQLHDLIALTPTLSSGPPMPDKPGDRPLPEGRDRRDSYRITRKGGRFTVVFNPWYGFSPETIAENVTHKQAHAAIDRHWNQTGECQ